MSIIRENYTVPYYKSVTESVAPASEPVTSKEAKDYIGLVHSDDDDIVRDMVKASRLIIEKYLNKSIINRTLLAKFMGFENKYPLPMGPVTAVTSVKRVVNGVETVLTEGTDYNVIGYDSDVRIVVNAHLSVTTGTYWPEIHVVYTAGLGASNTTIPADVKIAVLEQFKHLYEQKDDIENNKPVPSIIPKVRMMLGDYFDYGF